MLKRLVDQLWKLRWVRIIADALRSYNQHHCIHMAAAISFYSIIALAPLAYLAFWLLQLIVGSSAVAQKELAQLLQEYLLPPAADSLMQFIRGVKSVPTLGNLAAWAALGALAWAGTSFYESLQAIFTLAWGGSSRRFISRKVRALAALVCAALFVVMTMVMSTGLALLNTGADSWLSRYVSPVLIFTGWLAPYLLSIVVFFLLYKFMPNTHVPWQLATLLAIPVGILWEVSKRVFTNASILSFQHSFYGPVAWFVIVMVWIYWSSTIVLMGAEIGAAWQRQVVEEYYPETG